MAAWLNGGKTLTVDLESTGTSVHDDRIVTACAAIVADGTVLYQREWLVAVDVDIPEAATAVHGVSTEHAREHGVPAAEAVPEIANAIRYAVHSSIPVVAYNAAFDLSMINAECVRHGLGTLAEFCGRDITPVIDPLCLDKAVDRFRKGSRKLVDTAAFYGVALSDEDAHTAGADALAAARVAAAIAARCDLPDVELRTLYGDRRYPNEIVRAFRALGALSIDRLHAAQVQWYREQAEGLGDFWAKKAHDARLTAAQHADRLADCDPTEADDIDKARVAAEAEADELDARIASLTYDWPLCPIPEGAVA